MGSSDSSTLGTTAAGSAGAARTTSGGGDAGDVATARERDAADAARGGGGGAGGAGRGIAIAGVLIFAVLAAAIAAFVTREGAGLTPDSRGYLLVAEQISLGNGITMLDGDGKKVPLTHCPPLYPVMLWAGDKLLPASAQAAARAMGIALFALNVALIGMLAWRASGRSATAALLAAGLAAVALDLVLVHSMVWTEATFTLCTFASLYWLGKCLDTARLAPLALAALLAGLAFATRYAGAALMLTSGLLVLFGTRKAWGRRIADAFVFSIISAGGMFLWMLRNASITGDADSHAFAWHPPNISDLKNALVTAGGWVGSWQTSDTTPRGLVIAMMAFGLLVALAALVLLVATLRSARRVANDTTPNNDDRAPRPDSLARTDSNTGAGAGLRRALVWFVPVYVAFVLVSVSFFDAHVPLDRRILSPVHVVLIILLTAAVAAASAPARRVGVALIVLLIAFQGMRATLWGASAPRKHLGYATRDWRTSPTMAAVRAIPPEMTIFTNGVDAIYLRGDRFAKPLPKVTDPTKAARDSRFRKSMNGMRDYLAARGGYVVYFHNIPRAYMIPPDQLIEAIPMERVKELPDGVIYRRLPDAAGAATTSPVESRAGNGGP